jgi:RNA-directed DNA polymerase
VTPYSAPTGNADALIAKLNPIISGWAAYYRIGVSKRACGALDAHMWRLVYKWAKFTHTNKPKRWIIARYFGRFNSSRQDRWVFGSPETGFYLRTFEWTKIVRHRMVAGRASPDDPALTGYWAERRRRTRAPVDSVTWRLIRQQRGRCPLCRGLLLHADHEPQSPREWEQWLTATRRAIRKHAIVSAAGLGTPDGPNVPHLIHTHCRHRLGDGKDPALLLAREPSGLA